MPKIDARHPKLTTAVLAAWQQIRDCMEGQATIKAARSTYLPQPNPSDSSPENTERYNQYIARAVFHNATGRTAENMVGQVFSVDPIYTGPTELEFLLSDIDGAGVTASQQSKKALHHVISFSRGGLLVDYPKTNGQVTVADKEAGKIRAKVLFIEPWRIINWRTTLQGAKSKLSLLVIEEDYISNDDGYEAKYEQQWRVLRLVDNIYSVEIWRKGTLDFLPFEANTPTDGAGKPFDEIPFVFLGAESNDPVLEKPLLLDISNLNLAHYRNSADYEEAVYMVGQPTLALSGLDKDWVSTVMKGAIMLGSRSAILLPEGGAATLVQAAANTMPFEAMQQKQDMMNALGAKLVEKSEVAQTATEAGLNEASETSILAGCAQNVSEGYKQAFEWAARFENVTVPTEGILWELNREFAVSRMSPEQQQATLAVYNGGLITFEEARDKLKSGGVGYLDDEEAKDQLDEQAEKDLAAAKAMMPPAVPAPGAKAPAKAPQETES